ncbi:MAG: hypothetical protein MJ109_02330 [Kiritimatiellae bacterium]|nr:hypothetical protein [Kiritimatiellia bacterium]
MKNKIIIDIDKIFRFIAKHPKETIVCLCAVLILIAFRNIDLKIGSIWGEGFVVSAGGTATFGDDSPLVVNSTNVTICINKTYYDSAPTAQEVDKPVETAFISFKRMQRVGKGFESLGISVKRPETVTTDMLARLILLLRKLDVARARLDMDRMMYYSMSIKYELERLIALSMPFSDDAKQLLLKAIEGPCEAAWYAGDFEEIKNLVNKVVSISEISAIPLAYLRMSELLQANQLLYMPDYNELNDIKSFDIGFAFDYMNIFARWGYLRPIFDYELALGLYDRFDYLEVVDGLSYMAIGLWDYMLVNIDDIYRKVLNFECPGEEYDFEKECSYDENALQDREIIVVPEPNGKLLILFGLLILAMRRKAQSCSQA